MKINVQTFSLSKKDYLEWTEEAMAKDPGTEIEVSSYNKETNRYEYRRLKEYTYTQFRDYVEELKENYEVEEKLLELTDSTVVIVVHIL